MTYEPEDELTSVQVAELIGVEAATIRTYRYRGDMPQPTRYVGVTPVWRYCEIAAWTRSRPAAAGKGGPAPRVVLS